MSGSPVYIDGKIIGAVAFSFSFAKEPIAGITPIGEMLAIAGDSSGKPAGNGPSSFFRAGEPAGPVRGAPGLFLSAGAV